MLVLKKIYLLFFLLLNLSLAKFVEIRMDHDVTLHSNDPDKVYFWSSILTFRREPTDNQLIRIAEDGFKSLLESAKSAHPNVGSSYLPRNIVALAHANADETWRVYLASSTKGKGSLIYTITQAHRDRERCGEMHPRVPQELRDALNECSQQTGTSQHKNDGSCGELGAILLMASNNNGGSLRVEENAGWKIVSWGAKKKFNYTPLGTKQPCPGMPNGFGCANWMQILTPGIRFIDTVPNPEADGNGDSYTDNMPIDVEFQPLLPNSVQSTGA